MPAVIRPVSAATPLRQYRDLLISVTGPQPVGLHWLWLVLWAVTFGALATIAYRHNEGIRYR
ncbi:MAG: hypothetical protein GEV09_19405 [Pseudonocardiaceae bacterium]|nr:hypothetical protein [Pseudonocardiaceae bacterium]